MKFCRHCGTEMQPEAKVCLSCGISEGTSVKKETAYCRYCGEKMNNQAVVCIKCGVQQKSGENKDKTTRAKKGRLIAGVCKGISNSKDINVWVVRIAFILLNFLFVGLGTIGYIIAALALPKAEEE